MSLQEVLDQLREFNYLGARIEIERPLAKDYDSSWKRLFRYGDQNCHIAFKYWVVIDDGRGQTCEQQAVILEELIPRAHRLGVDRQLRKIVDDLRIERKMRAYWDLTERFSQLVLHYTADDAFESES
jgi:hypothetical protein